LLAEAEGNVVGCVAIRPMEDGEAELKRLYVAPEVRGRQVGRALVMEALHTARSAGIQKLFLDTLATMDRAIAVYQRVGFRPCPAPRKVPYEAQFFAMDFGAVPAKASSNE
jgi:N-acetylglutamate synthase-like GNAT family acetyltransferase